jgi:hypothetical protein
MIIRRTDVTKCDVMHKTKNIPLNQKCDKYLDPNEPFEVCE